MQDQNEWLTLLVSHWIIYLINLVTGSFRNKISDDCLYDCLDRLVQTNYIQEQTSASIYTWVAESFTQLMCSKTLIHSGTKHHYGVLLWDGSMTVNGTYSIEKNDLNNHLKHIHTLFHFKVIFSLSK